MSDEQETTELRQRIAELEALASDPDAGLWRFWNAKAEQLAKDLEQTRMELRFSKAIEESATAMINLPHPEVWKHAYVMEHYAQEYLEYFAEGVRRAVMMEFGLTEEKT